MIKPNNYDNIQAFGAFTPLELGGHILIVKKVEEIKSSNGKDMIKIFLDTHTSDKQPNYYEDQYKKNTKEKKSWGCIVYQLVLDAKGEASRGLKTFIKSVEESNHGFKVQWGENFVNCFKDKLVGGIFGREEYLNNYGESKFAIKCFNFRNADAIKNGVDIPADRLLAGNSSNYPEDDDLIQVSNGGNLPF